MNPEEGLLAEEEGHLEEEGVMIALGHIQGQGHHIIEVKLLLFVYLFYKKGIEDTIREGIIEEGHLQFPVAVEAEAKAVAAGKHYSN